MFRDDIQYKGHFTVQSIDRKTHEIIDEYVEDNLIMEASRTSMANIFAQITGQTTVSELVLGTFGHEFTGSNVGLNIVSPKTSADGFVKTRDRLFSESVSYDDTATSVTLNQNDLILYTGTANPAGATNTYYIWLGVTTSAINISTTNFADTTMWTNMGTTEPMNYHVEFAVPNVASGPLNSIHEYGLTNYTVWNNTTDYTVGVYVEDNGIYYQCATANGPSTTIVEPGVTTGWATYWTQVTWNDQGSTGTIAVSTSNVTFTIDIAETAANNTGIVTYTEAALYVGTQIFSMKTFPAKVKDNSILLRVIWTIAF